jgi:hypothetical protein
MVRAKFVVTKVENVGVASKPDEERYHVELHAVYEGSPENKDFFKWTPNADIRLDTVNPSAAKRFVQGKEYYVDFTEVSEAASLLKA